MNKTTKWLFIRLLIVATGVLNGLSTFEQGVFSSWIMIVVVFMFTPLFIVFVVSINARRFDSIWHPPNWYLNPFTLKQPFQFFHLLAYQVIVTGITALIKGNWTDTSLLPWTFLNLSFGIGLLIGIFICTSIFNDRVSSE